MSRHLRQVSTVMAIVIGGLSLSACETTMAHTQWAGYSTAPMAQAGIFQHPRINGGVTPAEAKREIEEVLSPACQKQADGQVASPFQSAVTGAVPGAIVGAVSLEQDAKILHDPKNVVKLVTKEGAANGAINGGYNNTVTGAISAAGTIGACTRDFWNISKTYKPDHGGPDFTAAKYKGTAVESIVAGKGFGGGPKTDNN